MIIILFQGVRRRSSDSLHSVSDESDTEPSPPVSRRERRQAFPSIFDSKVNDHTLNEHPSQNNPTHTSSDTISYPLFVPRIRIPEGVCFPYF